MSSAWVIQGLWDWRMHNEAYNTNLPVVLSPVQKLGFIWRVMKSWLGKPGVWLKFASCKEKSRGLLPLGLNPLVWTPHLEPKSGLDSGSRCTQWSLLWTKIPLHKAALGFPVFLGRAEMLWWQSQWKKHTINNVALDIRYVISGPWFIFSMSTVSAKSHGWSPCPSWVNTVSSAGCCEFLPLSLPLLPLGMVKQKLPERF